MMSAIQIQHLSQEINKAVVRLQPYRLETPCYKSLALSNLTGANVYLKCEHLQVTGSFKIRGALNKMLSLSPAQLETGIVTASSGNHGKAVAYAANLLGCTADIFLPRDTPKSKLQVIEMLNAHIFQSADECGEAERLAQQYAHEVGKVYISPYNDADVVAGQGTIGYEIAQQIPNVDAVFASVGGGGLISGIGCYLSEMAQMVGCWPENSPALYRALEAGAIQDVPERPTLSDGTAGQVVPDAITLALCQDLIEQKVKVSEDEIKKALRLLADVEQFMIEGAAGVALAAFIKTAEKYRGKTVVLVLCGRNIDTDIYVDAIAR